MKHELHKQRKSYKRSKHITEIGSGEMELITKKIFEDLEELMMSNDIAQVGDEVIVKDLYGYTKYVVADINDDEIKFIRKTLFKDHKPMKTENFDLKEWLDSEYRRSITENLPDNIIKLMGVVTIPTVKEVYGVDKFDTKLEGSQWKWFENRENRIAFTDNEDDELSDYWWLRVAVSAAHFAGVDANGYCYYNYASLAWVGVRPAFSIRKS